MNKIAAAAQSRSIGEFVMTLICRPAREDDLERAEELVVGSINDLTTRHGFGPMATPSPPRFQSFSLKDDPGGLWVAEENGEMRGFAFSWSAAISGFSHNCLYRRRFRVRASAMNSFRGR
jgi:hypothetical protein